MNSDEPVPSASPKKRVNLRAPEVMALVQTQVQQHYRGDVVEKIRGLGGTLSVGGVTVRLAKEFGFCYGVERAIDLAYAARRVFKDRRIFILGEIIHNPEVNEQISEMGIKNLIGRNRQASIEDLTEEDIVIVPAFGAEVKTIEKIRQRGCQVVDTTCGDVMSVWKRVRQNANDRATSIIHGKADHEETRATSSQAVANGHGHYLVVRDLAETDYVCDFIRHGGDRDGFLARFENSCSPGFDPDVDLRRVGVANQTTMMRGETEEVQRRIHAAIVDRDGEEKAKENYRFFDTICGATQERQDALKSLLEGDLDLLLVVGGYNSSNTSHLAEMGQARLPTYFIRNAAKLESEKRIVHFSLAEKREIVTTKWLPQVPFNAGVTAGASCPNNLIEETIIRLYDLGGVSLDQVLGE